MGFNFQNIFKYGMIGDIFPGHGQVEIIPTSRDGCDCDRQASLRSQRRFYTSGSDNYHLPEIFPPLHLPTNSTIYFTGLR